MDGTKQFYSLSEIVHNLNIYNSITIKHSTFTEFSLSLKKTIHIITIRKLSFFFWEDMNY